MHEMCSLTTFLHSSNNSCSMYSINSKESEREGSVFKCLMCLMCLMCMCMMWCMMWWCVWCVCVCVLCGDNSNHQFWLFMTFHMFLGLFEHCLWAYLSAVFTLFELCLWAYLSAVSGLIWALFMGLFERCIWAYLSAVYGLIWALFIQ